MLEIGGMGRSDRNPPMTLPTERPTKDEVPKPNNAVLQAM
jgi:hypothetical protein